MQKLVYIYLNFIVLTDVEDYNGTRITVDVPAGVLTQSFTIDIIDNDVVECDELFSVTIENVTACGVTTGDVISSNVTIMDDDGEWSDYCTVYCYIKLFLPQKQYYH